MIRRLVCLSALVLFASISGCSSKTDVETATVSPQPSAEGEKYLLSDAPAESQDVIPTLEDVEDGQDVVVIGRIGGDVNPWVEGLAAFSIVDRSLAACTDIPGDKCPTPWDYCCVTDQLKGAKTLVKVVDEEGEVIQTDARKLLGLEELQTLVIKGQARKDDAGNVTLLAHAIYVDPANPGQVKWSDLEKDHDHAHDHDHSDADETKSENDNDSSVPKVQGD